MEHDSKTDQLGWSSEELDTLSREPKHAAPSVVTNTPARRYPVTEAWIRVDRHLQRFSRHIFYLWIAVFCLLILDLFFISVILAMAANR